MFSSNQQQEFRKVIKEFAQAKYDELGTHSYAAGYFESLAVSMFASLSKKEQKFYMEQMQDSVAKLQHAE
jgi:hypothetical protein